jgi:hypoxanthine phosphoribosyltransferase
MVDHINEVLLTENNVKSCVDSLARLIAIDYKESRVVTLLCVLKGSFIFTADLARSLFAQGIRTEVSFIQLSSYTGIDKGDISVILKPGESLQDKDVIIVEDIIDTGTTLEQIELVLKSMSPKSIRTAALFIREGIPPIQYAAMVLRKNEFVVGYGLDYKEDLRYLPYVGVYEAD